MQVNLIYAAGADQLEHVSRCTAAVRMPDAGSIWFTCCAICVVHCAYQAWWVLTDSDVFLENGLPCLEMFFTVFMQMEARNLAIVFGPTLVRTADNSMLTMITDMSHQCHITEALINYVRQLTYAAQLLFPVCSLLLHLNCVLWLPWIVLVLECIHRLTHSNLIKEDAGPKMTENHKNAIFLESSCIKACICKITN